MSEEQTIPLSGNLPGGYTLAQPVEVTIIGMPDGMYLASADAFNGVYTLKGKPTPEEAVASLCEVLVETFEWYISHEANLGWALQQDLAQLRAFVRKESTS